ncbi:MAG: hypothetical protein ABGX27_07950 [Desulfurobacteriaceae bacterium]
MAKENLKELERYLDILLEQGYDDDDFLATDAPVLEEALTIPQLKEKAEEFIGKHKEEILFYNPDIFLQKHYPNIYGCIVAFELT